jgi:hypothetical protein
MKRFQPEFALTKTHDFMRTQFLTVHGRHRAPATTTVASAAAQRFHVALRAQQKA